MFRKNKANIKGIEPKIIFKKNSFIRKSSEPARKSQKAPQKHLKPFFKGVLPMNNIRAHNIP